MSEITSFSFGDAVFIIGGEFRGRTGAVVGMDNVESPSVFTVEFGDGSDVEVLREFVEKLAK